jgi:hypothetical protein
MPSVVVTVLVSLLSFSCILFARSLSLFCHVQRRRLPPPHIGRERERETERERDREREREKERERYNDVCRLSRVPNVRID